MTQFIKDYISSCHQCSRNNNIHHKKFGLLKPLPIPNGPWICLSMDFITQLPLSNSFDLILVIVDRFSNMAFFIPTMSSITSLDLAHLFINNIFSKHGPPSSIVSDRGPLFVSSFWTNICQQLKISRDLSTAYHPETDGQTERVNQILEQYLWIDPQFDSVQITQDTPAGKLSTKIQSVHQDFKRELEVAINQFKRYADKSRASPPDLNPGDMVWCSSKNIKSARPTKKLSEGLLGPFPILKIVSTHAYQLKLPSQWKSIHPVLHISLLEPVKTSTIPNWHQEPPPPIIIEEEEELEVSHILDSKLKRRKLWYLVKWKGFRQDSERSTWEPAENLNIVLILSKISILCILTSQDPILQKLEFLWCLVGRGITKGKSHSWGVLAQMAPYSFYSPWAVIHGPWSAGHTPRSAVYRRIRPFGPNPMRPKGAKGGNHLAPKARWVPNHNWAHLSQFWPSIPWTPNLAINPSGPKFGHRP
ncbi:hypothetical protein O181_105557 [Austropuccinia psidii MF-1]|uniref:Integrase catalytic domain-containing protein n=1 Tax=Austropuccinia psidii MF-1 TaxID=1389203 RepID=A0A9Q3JNR0_9BASI|nr:hypothetical protein [Austropuccinia psidii MF-1]